ncbi:endolytic transglycosylase MltG [Candidatus Falkowbacteria bacterium]|nr:endolytic transglycosylase MltG [Candidatus Falkowbacteria bacterium]
MKKIIFLIILAVILTLVIWVLKITFISQSGTGENKIFIINEGEGVNQISRNLKQAGLIDNSFIFETYLWLIKSGSKIMAGEHVLSDKWSIKSLCRVLITGSYLENEDTIKIIEGWNLRDIANYLEKQGICTVDEFYFWAGRPAVNYNIEKKYERTTQNWSESYHLLENRPENYSLEGFLFPDTYRIYKNSKPQEIIQKMLSNFERKVNKEILADIKAQKKDLYDILILASIIEKEAKTYDDKRRVAGVYYNRMNIGMALQADPTVNYVTGNITDRPSYDEIKTDSLFNTYKYPGLPPTPICNPGLDSIRAAVYPERNGYYYFLNTPDGQLIFSKTLEEHKRNRLKYFND